MSSAAQKLFAKHGLDLLAHGAHARDICATCWRCSWKSGVRNNSATTGFAVWRGLAHGGGLRLDRLEERLDGMYNYASGSSPRSVRAKSSNVSFGHGLFP